MLNSRFAKSLITLAITLDLVLFPLGVAGQQVIFLHHSTGSNVYTQGAAIQAESGSPDVSSEVKTLGN